MVNSSDGEEIDLRLGLPYSNLVRWQRHFSDAAARWWGIDSENIIATAGSTGAIEAVRNHCLKISPCKNPVLLTVQPGYWRARESFQSFNFKVSEIRTEKTAFTIDIWEIIKHSEDIAPEVLYLSLPNNPTGATFDVRTLVQNLPEQMLIMLDMTLPSPDLDTPELLTSLAKHFLNRPNLFLIGSTSKSHGTAEHRVGWLVCSSRKNADELRQENRNVVSSFAIREGMKQFGTVAPAAIAIRKSFELLKAGEGRGGFQIITPDNAVRSCYVLLKLKVPIESVKHEFSRKRIRVMWGTEMGLTDIYLRVETLIPQNVEVLVETLCCLEAVALPKAHSERFQAS